MTNNNNTLKLSSIITVDVDGNEISTGVSFTPKSVETTVNVGDISIRHWNNNLHVVTLGASGEGKESISLQGYKAVAGFFNALRLVHDHRDMFSVLTQDQHLYAASANREYAEAAGYVSVLVNDEDLAGLQTRMWKAVRSNGGGSYASAGLVKPVNYTEARAWGKAARDANDHAWNIIYLHDGLNMVLAVLAGSHSVSFETYKWSDDSKSALNAKILAFMQDKSFRDAIAKDGDLRKNIADQVAAGLKIARAGQLAVSKGAPASYKSAMMETIDCSMEAMVGKKFYIQQKSGARLGFEFYCNTVEEVAVRLGVTRGIEGILVEVAE